MDLPEFGKGLSLKRQMTKRELEVAPSIHLKMNEKDFKNVWKRHRGEIIDFQKGPKKGQLFLIHHLIMN